MQGTPASWSPTGDRRRGALAAGSGRPKCNRREIRAPRMIIDNPNRWLRTMRFQANYISTSISGDYCQAMFAAKMDPGDPGSPYLLLQPQFEMPDGGECYIETHDRKYIGHFLVRRVEFTPEKLSIEFDLPADNLINVTFDMTIANFKKMSRVVRIIRQMKSAR
jgi:hypothetical protein